MKRLGFIVVMVLFVVVFGLQAQETPREARGEYSHPHMRPYRESDVQVQLSFPGTGIEKREFKVFRSAETERKDTASVEYFHRPLNAFIVNEDPILGYPDIVHRVTLDPMFEGNMLLTFKVAITTEKFKKLCLEKCYQQDWNYITRSCDGPGQATMSGWTLKHMIIDCISDGKLLGTGSTDNIHGKVDCFTIQLSFGPEELKDFLQKVKEDHVDFRPRYLYVGQREYTASKEVNVDSSIMIEVEKHLSSDQLEKNSPIFQEDFDRISREVAQTFITEIRANNKKVLPILGEHSSNLAKMVLQEATPLSYDTMKDQYQYLDEALVAYLKPHLEESRFHRKTSDKTTHTLENKDRDKSTLEVKFKNLFDKSLDITDESEHEQTITDKLERITGVTFEETDESEWFRPHRIRHYKLKKGAEKYKLRDSSIVYYAIGKKESYLQDMLFKASFTTDVLDRAIAVEMEEYYPFCTFPGMIVPFIGIEPPPGWAWCDGAAKFKAPPWLPTHLHYQNIFDAHGIGFGGAPPLYDEDGKPLPGFDPAFFGTLWNQGEISIPGHTVNGSSFGVSLTPNQRHVAWLAPETFKSVTEKFCSMSGVSLGSAKVYDDDFIRAFQAKSITGQVNVSEKKISLDTKEELGPYIMVGYIIKLHQSKY